LLPQISALALIPLRDALLFYLLQQTRQRQLFGPIIELSCRPLAGKEAGDVFRRGPEEVAIKQVNVNGLGLWRIALQPAR
jgi:hypothetical protein